MYPLSPLHRMMCRYPTCVSVFWYDLSDVTADLWHIGTPFTCRLKKVFHLISNHFSSSARTSVRCLMIITTITPPPVPCSAHPPSARQLYMTRSPWTPYTVSMDTHTTYCLRTPYLWLPIIPGDNRMGEALSVSLTTVNRRSGEERDPVLTPGGWFSCDCAMISIDGSWCVHPVGLCLRICISPGGFV